MSKDSWGLSRYQYGWYQMFLPINISKMKRLCFQLTYKVNFFWPWDDELSVVRINGPIFLFGLETLIPSVNIFYAFSFICLSPPQLQRTSPIWLPMWTSTMDEFSWMPSRIILNMIYLAVCGLGEPVSYFTCLFLSLWHRFACNVFGLFICDCFCAPILLSNFNYL